MAIELGPSTTAPKPASTADAKNDQEKSVESESSDVAALGGFWAILGALDTPQAESTLANTALQGNALTEADADAQVPLDATALLAQSTQWALPQSAGSVAGGGGNAPGAKNATARVWTDASLVLPQGLTTGTKGLGPFGSAKGQSHVSANQAAFSAALSSGAGAGVNGQEGVQPFQGGQKGEVLPTALAAVEATLVNTAVALRHEDPGHERSIFKGAAVESAPPPPTVVAGAASANTPGTSPLAASIAASPADGYVAEQVKYWVSSDVQKAEMSLDGIGDRPVEVSISMQGNEAHVAFRSDEVQAREALENAEAHLKEMLQDEGLVLTGVSVGTAGADSSGRQERDVRQGVRQVTVSSVEPVATERASKAERGTGRTLDIFV